MHAMRLAAPIFVNPVGAMSAAATILSTLAWAVGQTAAPGPVPERPESNGPAPQSESVPVDPERATPVAARPAPQGLFESFASNLLVMYHAPATSYGPFQAMWRIITRRGLAEWSRRLLSSYVSRQVERSPLLYKDRFASVSIPTNARRSAVQREIKKLAADLGVPVWADSVSESEAARVDHSSRVYYDVGDFKDTFRHEPPPQRCLIQFLDIDWYKDLEQLGQHASLHRPMALYTFAPTSMMWKGEAGSFRISEETMCYRSSYSRKTYTHKLWNWDTPSVLLSSSTHHVMYDVCMKKLADHRCLVFLVPVWSIPLSQSWCLNYFGGNRELQRIRTHVKDGVESFRSEGFVEIAELGSNLVYRMSEQDYEDTSSASKAKSASIGVLERVAGKANAYHLRELLMRQEPVREFCAPTLNVGDTPRTYAPCFSDITPEPKVAGSVCSPPIIDGAFSPVEGPNSDEACVEYRIEKMRAHQKEVPERFHKYKREFIGHLKNRRMKPLPLSDLLDSVSGKKFKAYFQASEAEMVHLIYKSFQKTEAYPDVKDPRNISNVDKKHVVRWLQFTQAMAAMLKENTWWYGFGSSPKQTADLVHRIVSHHLMISITDYTRYDGTLSEFLRSVERDTFKELFEEQYSAQIDEFCDLLIDQVVRTKYGRKYQSGSSRFSGEAGTSVCNTLVNAFANYCALRDSGMGPEEAWGGLGIYGGDDGLTYHPDPAVAEKTMEDLELKFKSEVRVAGQTVEFLGRVYLDPWTDSRSHHDILRAAGKMHFSPTNSQNASYEQMAWRKAVSIVVTDSQTPILSEWARKVLELIPNGTLESDWWTDLINLEGNTRYTSKDILEEYGDAPVFPGPNREEWPLIEERILANSPITGSHLTKWRRDLKKARRISEFPAPLWSVVPSIPKHYPVEVDGGMIGPPMKKSVKAPCRRFLEGKCEAKSCKFEHPAKFCRNFVRGECKHLKCKFPHLK